MKKNRLLATIILGTILCLGYSSVSANEQISTSEKKGGNTVVQYVNHEVKKELRTDFKMQKENLKNEFKSSLASSSTLSNYDLRKKRQEYKIKLDALRESHRLTMEKVKSLSVLDKAEIKKLFSGLPTDIQNQLSELQIQKKGEIQTIINTWKTSIGNNIPTDAQIQDLKSKMNTIQESHITKVKEILKNYPEIISKIDAKLQELKNLIS